MPRFFYGDRTTFAGRSGDENLRAEAKHQADADCAVVCTGAVLFHWLCVLAIGGLLLDHLDNEGTGLRKRSVLPAWTEGAFLGMLCKPVLSYALKFFFSSYIN